VKETDRPALWSAGRSNIGGPGGVRGEAAALPLDRIEHDNLLVRGIAGGGHHRRPKEKMRLSNVLESPTMPTGGRRRGREAAEISSQLFAPPLSSF